MFQEHLAELLPPDLPGRDAVAASAARHLALIVDVNQRMNLTRILDPREAVIKHVLDCVLPWRLFADAKEVLDAGTGPGFPGIPLALALPGTRFTLAESTQKKARFVESVVDALEIANANVLPDRAEDLLRKRPVELITARALAPLSRALDLFNPAVKRGARVLLYKGPDAEREIAEAAGDARHRRVHVRVAMRYDLPDALGSRTIVELTDYARV